MRGAGDFVITEFTGSACSGQDSDTAYSSANFFGFNLKPGGVLAGSAILYMPTSCRCSVQRDVTFSTHDISITPFSSPMAAAIRAFSRLSRRMMYVRAFSGAEEYAQADGEVAELRDQFTAVLLSM